MRSRVAFDRCGAGVTKAHRERWRRAEQAHRRMLDAEAQGGLFDDPERAAELGGLFLLTNTPDNWAKRPDSSTSTFGCCGPAFGLERNLGLRINRFSLDGIAGGGVGAGGRLLALRRAAPIRAATAGSTMRCTRSWRSGGRLLRLLARVRPRRGLARTSEAALAELVLADWHDVEQKNTGCRPRQSGGGGGSPSASPGPRPPPAPAPGVARGAARAVPCAAARAGRGAPQCSARWPRSASGCCSASRSSTASRGCTCVQARRSPGDAVHRERCGGADGRARRRARRGEGRSGTARGANPSTTASRSSRVGASWARSRRRRTSGCASAASDGLAARVRPRLGRWRRPSRGAGWWRWARRR